MKLSLITLFMLHRNEHASLREVYTAVKRAGFEAVDLCSYDFAHGTEEEIRALLKELGLKVACYIDFVPSPAIGNAAAAQRAREQIRRNLDLTERLGAGVYMFAPGGYADFIRGVPREKVAEAFAEDLAYAVELADKKGITVVIEDAPDITFPMCSAEEVLALLEKVPGLRHVFDTGNMIAQGDDPVEFYDQLAPYLSHAHLKDMRFSDGTPTPGYGVGDFCANGRYMVGVLHGEGMVDFATLLPRIKKSGFDGYMAVEYVPQKVDSDFAAEMIQCREYLERLWNHS